MFIYFTDDGDVAALRFDDWKMLFMEQRVTGTLKIWQEPFVTLRCPYIFNLRMDPYEHAQITSNTYYDWMFRHIYLLVPAQALVAEFLGTFTEFPPRQKAASFSLDQVLDKMTVASKGAQQAQVLEHSAANTADTRLWLRPSAALCSLCSVRAQSSVCGAVNAGAPSADGARPNLELNVEPEHEQRSENSEV